MQGTQGVRPHSSSIYQALVMFLPASGPQFPPQYKEPAQIIPKPLDMKDIL